MYAFDGLMDRRTEGFTIIKTALHSLQRGKNVSYFAIQCVHSAKVLLTWHWHQAQCILLINVY